MESVKLKPLVDLQNIGGVLAHGVFDLLHIGHIRHLLAARALLPEGPLTVTITADRFVRKGPGRPVFSAEIRAECLVALACVDHVAIVEEATGQSAITVIRPQFYVKGREYEQQKGDMERERWLVENYCNGRVIYTDMCCSSTALLSGHWEHYYATLR